jgi:hypothetical protein
MLGKTAPAAGGKRWQDALYMLLLLGLADAG